MTVSLDLHELETTALLDFAGILDHLRVLEIGCGDGRLTRRYAAQAAHVTAIDPSPEKIILARGNLPVDLRPRVEFHTADLEQFETIHKDKQRFDLAILAWSL
jgi:2-polyprenyl-3-methyl-5-hydroxy-6-metoxy-1,4-benzoquinol methylase